jgi:hypothetical protein
MESSIICESASFFDVLLRGRRVVEMFFLQHLEGSPWSLLSVSVFGKLEGDE